MDALAPTTMLLLCLAFVPAGTVKGATGMSLPRVAMALMGSVMPPVLAAAFLVVPSFATNVWQLFLLVLMVLGLELVTRAFR